MIFRVVPGVVSPMIKTFVLCSLFFCLVGCQASTGRSVVSYSNEFTRAGSNLSVASVAGSTYYGRVLFKSGGQLYGASVHFDLSLNDPLTAFFASFYLDRLVLFVDLQTVVPIVTTSINLLEAPSYASATNAFSVTNAASRYVGFNLDYSSNSNFTDVLNAAGIFSRDFSTFVGGDASTFFFIAQKASSMADVSTGDLAGTWYMIDFTVAGLGSVQVGSPSKNTVNGTGGSGFTIFQGINVSGATVYAGELNITDAGSGVIGWGYDSTPSGGGTITMDGSVDGAFLVSPSKNFVLGFDSRNDRYFAGSR